LFGDHAMIPTARSWSTLRGPLCSSSLAVLLCLPLIQFVLIDFRYQHDLREPRPLSVAALAYTNLSLYSGYALGVSQRELHSPKSGKITESALWLGIIVVIQLGLAWLSWKNWRQDSFFPYALGLAIIPFPFLGMLGSAVGITYNVRFVAWIIVPISMLLGRACESARAKHTHYAVAIGFGVLFGIAVIANYQRVYSPRYQFEDLRSVAQWIQREGQPADSVYSVSHYLASPLRYYMVDFAEVIELPAPGEHGQVFTSASMAKVALERVRANQKTTVWVAYSRPFHGDPEGLFLKALTEANFVLEHRFAGVDLYRRGP